MTKEQIIKALECCFVNRNCEGCPQYAKKQCLEEASKEALSLILSHEETIKELKERLNSIYGENAVLSSKRETLWDRMISHQRGYERGKADAAIEIFSRIKGLGVVIHFLSSNDRVAFDLPSLKSLEMEFTGRTLFETKEDTE